MFANALNAVVPLLVMMALCLALLTWLGQRVRVSLQNSGALPRAHRSFTRDHQGGVQSLAFVLTFPILLLLVLFIIQISQLMIGNVVVQYAAFAAARAASVWLPAVTDDGSLYTSGRRDDANLIPSGIGMNGRYLLNADSAEAANNRKAREIHSAAVLACLPLAPSRTIREIVASEAVVSTAASLNAVVRSMDAGAANNARMPIRLLNMLSYSNENTVVQFSHLERSSIPLRGVIRTYNPYDHPRVGHLGREVGWQDPVIVLVNHKFALMPGPARWIAAGMPTSRSRIVHEQGVYKTTLTGTATMTVEGLQSLHPRRHEP